MAKLFQLLNKMANVPNKANNQKIINEYKSRILSCTFRIKISLAPVKHCFRVSKQPSKHHRISGIGLSNQIALCSKYKLYNWGPVRPTNPYFLCKQHKNSLSGDAHLLQRTFFLFVHVLKWFMWIVLKC